MLDLLCAYLLPTPLHALIAALAAAAAGGAGGWWLASAKIREAWTRVAERPAAGAPHVYRGAPTRAEIERPPRRVVAAALASHALCPGLAAGALVVIGEALRSGARTPLIAAGLLGLGALLAYDVHVPVSRGALRPRGSRRMIFTAIASLLGHGALVGVLAAAAAGAFDDRLFEVRGIKGMTSIMTLGEIRAALPERPILLSAGGHLLLTWQALGVAALVHGCLSVLSACLGLSTLPLSSRAEEPGAAGSPPAGSPPAGSLPRRAWARAGWLLVLGASVGAVLAGAVRHVAPRMAATGTYLSWRGACSLPELPRAAFDFESDHQVSLMSDRASVRFRTRDTAPYVAELLASGYREDTGPRGFGVAREQREERPAPDPFQHYHLEKEHPGELTTCDVDVDSESGLVLVRMWWGG